MLVFFSLMRCKLIDVRKGDTEARVGHINKLLPEIRNRAREAESQMIAVGLSFRDPKTRKWDHDIAWQLPEAHCDIRHPAVNPAGRRNTLAVQAAELLDAGIGFDVARSLLRKVLCLQILVEMRSFPRD